MFYAIVVFIAMLYLSGARAFFHFHRLSDRTCYKIFWFSSLWFLVILNMPSSLPKHKVWFSKLFWHSVAAKRSMLLMAISCYLFLNNYWKLSTVVDIVISAVFGVILAVIAVAKGSAVNGGDAEYSRYCHAVESCINIVLDANESEALRSAIHEDLSLESSQDFISFPINVVALYTQTSAEKKENIEPGSSKKLKKCKDKKVNKWDMLDLHSPSSDQEKSE